MTFMKGHDLSSMLLITQYVHFASSAFATEHFHQLSTGVCEHTKNANVREVRAGACVLLAAGRAGTSSRSSGVGSESGVCQVVRCVGFQFAQLPRFRNVFEKQRKAIILCKNSSLNFHLKSSRRNGFSFFPNVLKQGWEVAREQPPKLCAGIVTQEGVWQGGSLEGTGLQERLRLQYISGLFEGRGRDFGTL